MSENLIGFKPPRISNVAVPLNEECYGHFEFKRFCRFRENSEIMFPGLGSDHWTTSSSKLYVGCSRGKFNDRIFDTNAFKWSKNLQRIFVVPKRSVQKRSLSEVGMTAGITTPSYCVEMHRCDIAVDCPQWIVVAILLFSHAKRNVECAISCQVETTFVFLLNSSTSS